MESTEQAVSSRRSSRPTLEILSHLQQLSRDSAEGRLSRVYEAAVQLPINCLLIDKSILLSCSKNGSHFFPVRVKNVCLDALPDCSSLAKDSVIHSVVVNQSPKVIEDVSTCDTPLRHICTHEQVCSVACIPAVACGETQAVLIYMSCSKRAFAVWEIELMMTIASHVATACRIRLVDYECCPPQVSPVLDRLRQVLTATSVDDLLQNALREVITIVNADSGSIMLYDDIQCRIAAAYGLKENIDRRVARSVPTISNYIATHRKPLLLHGPVDTSKYPGVVPRSEIASSICVPLRAGKKVLGSLNLNRSSHKRPFGESDLDFTTAYVAQPLSIALEHKRLSLYKDDQASFLRHLYRIAKMITSSLEIEEVLDKIMDQLMSVGRADVCGLLLKDDTFGEFTMACGRGIPGGMKDDYAELMMPLALSLVGRARPTAVPDLDAHRAYTDQEVVRRLGLRSAAIIPLFIKRKNVGFIMVYSRQIASFPQSLLKLLAGLAELAAIAIENARHYERQLGIARITQRLLAPCPLVCIPGFEIGHKYIPAYQVGGDYYDLIKLSEDKFGLALADVSGKDVDAATHIALCKHSLRAVADHFDSPSLLLRKMNRLIYENTSPEAFVSMFYAVLDIEHRELTFSSAGHDPGLLYRADSRTVERVSTPGILLGIQPDAAFVDGRLSIKPGDTLLLYTDGLVFASSRDYETGISKIMATLIEHSLQPAQQLADNIHERTVGKHTAKLPDDIALIALKAVEE